MVEQVNNVANTMKLYCMSQTIQFCIF